MAMTISKEVLDELLRGVENTDDLLGHQSLLKELKVRLMERKFGAELTGYLGFHDLVPFAFRSLTSFIRPFVRRPKGFCHLTKNAAVVDYRTR